MSAGLLHRVGLGAGIVALAALTAVAPAAAAALMLAICACLLLNVRLIKLGFFAIVALVPLDSLGQLDLQAPIPITVTKLLFPPVLAAMLIQRVLSRRPFAGGRIGRYVALFGGAVLFSALMAGFGGVTLSGLRHYLSVLLLFVLAANVIETERDARVLLAVIVGGCLVSGLIGLLDWYTPLNLVSGRHWGAQGMRLSGASSENPNTFATNLLVALFLALAFALGEPRRGRRAALLLVAAMLLAAIAHAMSRAVALALVVAGLYLLVRLRHRVRAPAALLIVCALALVVLPFVPPAYFERIAGLVTERATDVTLHRRFAYNLIGLDLFRQSPIWGIGPDNFPLYYLDQDYRYLTDQISGARLLHNVYLLIACEMGLLGLLAFGAIIVESIRSLRASAAFVGSAPAGFLGRAAEAFEVALVAFLLSSLFLPNEHQKYMWILFAMPAALATMRAHGDDDAARTATDPTEGRLPCPPSA